MPHTRRYIFNTLTVVSLLLLVAPMLLWMDSLNTSRTVGWGTPSTRFVYQHFLGQIELRYVTNDNSDWPRGFFAFSESTEGGDIDLGTYDWFSFGFGGAWNHPSKSVPGYSWSKIGFPYPLITFLSAILPTIWLIKWNKRRKLGPNACPSCGYDLTGNESGICPECGHASETEATQA